MYVYIYVQYVCVYMYKMSFNLRLVKLDERRSGTNRDLRHLIEIRKGPGCGPTVRGGRTPITVTINAAAAGLVQRHGTFVLIVYVAMEL